jgi:hypothetical protein
VSFFLAFLLYIPTLATDTNETNIFYHNRAVIIFFSFEVAVQVGLLVPYVKVFAIGSSSSKNSNATSAGAGGGVVASPQKVEDE